MKRFTNVFMFAYMMVCIVCAAGAINYGVTNGVHIYTVAGVLNVVMALFAVIKAWKKVSDESYNK